MDSARYFLPAVLSFPDKLPVYPKNEAVALLPFEEFPVRPLLFHSQVEEEVVLPCLILAERFASVPFHESVVPFPLVKDASFSAILKGWLSKLNSQIG